MERDLKRLKGHTYDLDLSPTGLEHLTVDPLSIITRDFGQDDRRALRMTSKALSERMKKINTYVSRIDVEAWITTPFLYGKNGKIKRTVEFCWRNRQEYVNQFNSIVKVLMTSYQNSENPFINFYLNHLYINNDNTYLYDVRLGRKGFEDRPLKFDDIQDVTLSDLEQIEIFIQFKYDVELDSNEENSWEEIELDSDFEDAKQVAEERWPRYKFYPCVDQEGGSGDSKDFVSLKEAHRLIMQKNAVILDVRTREEYCQRHLCESLNIPLPLPPLKRQDCARFKGKLKRRLADVKKSQHIVVYCKKGTRAAEAIRALKSLGYRNLHNLGGVESSNLKRYLEKPQYRGLSVCKCTRAQALERGK